MKTQNEEEYLLGMQPNLTYLAAVPNCSLGMMVLLLFPNSFLKCLKPTSLYDFTLMLFLYLKKMT